MPIASGSVGLGGTTLEALILPKSSRARTSRTITTAAAISEGAITCSLTASASTAIKAGTSLSFQETSPSATVARKQIIVKDDVTIGTTATTVNIFGATTAVTSGETAVWYVGLIPVAGLQEFSMQTNDTDVDTTDTLSGTGMENRIIRSGLEYSISLIERLSDIGLHTVIKPVALDFAYKGREVLARITFPDGEIHQGAAQVKGFNQPGNQNEVKKVQFSLSFQGTDFDIVKPYTFV